MSGPGGGWRALLRRPLVAAAVLLACYLALGALTDHGGFLSTDTGGKVATLEAMSRAGAFDPDIGHWAAAEDPEGDLHPFYFTERIGDRYVNVTSLPMLVVARPLYDLGGYRAAMVVVALGGVAVALAARALARRVGDGDGEAAFWAVGLATPVAVYSLDLWEHAPGLALMAWAVVAVVDVVDRRRPWWWAVLAGLGFGAAATMRTEALVYGAAVVGAGLVVALLRRTSPPAVVGAGVAATVGLIVPLALNQALEEAVYGSALRSERAGGAASRAGGELGTRLGEGLLTTFGVRSAADRTVPVVLGVVVVALVVGAVVAGRRRSARAPLLVVLGAVLALSAAFASGLGFVPGMLVASPLATAGLVAFGRGRHGWLAVAAVAALPAVWLFQYTGGAGPQWGGRYQLTSGFVLAVLGVVVLGRSPRAVRHAVIAFAVVVTVGGVAWTVERTHRVADAFDRLEARRDELVVSRASHFLREGGAATLDRPWLTVSTNEELAEAVTLAEGRGLDRFVLLSVGDDEPARVEGWEPTTVEVVPLFDGEPIVLHTYRRTGG